MIRHHSQLARPAKPSLCVRWATLAIAALAACATSAVAQVSFRAPAFAPAATVAGQAIDQGLGGYEVLSTETAADQPTRSQGGRQRIEAQDSSTSFLPPRFRSGEAINSDQSDIDHLSDREFELRLRAMEDNGNSVEASVSGRLEPEPELGGSQSGRETIRQRHPNGKTHVLRQVTQDAAGNYYNDGAWRVYSRDGEVVAEGQFERNQMVGQWRRYHSAGSGGLFSTAPFNSYKGRFLSVAGFANGKLNGMWTIYDENNQKVFEVPYSKGKRDGTATWWFPTATKMREATFDGGLLNGKVMEWNEEGKLTRREEYINGQRVVRNVSLYRPKRPSEEQFYLDGKLELDGEDQWWEAQPAAFSSKGQRTQHGPVRRWYENGQPKMQGQYKKDQRVGEFTWWHPNGSRKLKAGYQAGQKSGMWTWWHENGMKSIQGEYEAGQPVGVWTWWDENGKVDRQEDFAKRQRATDGSSGELTEPTSKETDDDSDQDNTVMQDPSDENEPGANLGSDTSDPLPLLLDTDALEEINPLSDTPNPILDALSDDQ